MRWEWTLSIIRISVRRGLNMLSPARNFQMNLIYGMGLMRMKHRFTGIEFLDEFGFLKTKSLGISEKYLQTKLAS